MQRGRGPLPLPVFFLCPLPYILLIIILAQKTVWTLGLGRALRRRGASAGLARPQQAQDDDGGGCRGGWVGRQEEELEEGSWKVIRPVRLTAHPSPSSSSSSSSSSGPDRLAGRLPGGVQS